MMCSKMEIGLDRILAVKIEKLPDNKSEQNVSEVSQAYGQPVASEEGFQEFSFASWGKLEADDDNEWGTSSGHTDFNYEQGDQFVKERLVKTLNSSSALPAQTSSRRPKESHEASFTTKHRFGKKMKWFSCPECNLRYFRIAHLKSHINMMHKRHIQKYECPTCHERFSIKQTLNSHMGQHVKSERKAEADASRLFCPICGISHRSETSMRKHITVAHVKETPKLFQCSKCKERFATAAEQIQHFRTGQCTAAS